MILDNEGIIKNYKYWMDKSFVDAEKDESIAKEIKAFFQEYRAMEEKIKEELVKNE